MELQHFSHDHPLIFEEEYKDDGVKVSCYGCQQPISSGPCYFCRKCKDRFLHKLCAELPKEMKHPMHPEHQLNLLPSPPNYPQSPSSQSPCGCGVCGQPCKSFTYSCSLCKFDVEIVCQICEVKENGNCWFYHCAKCNKDFHPLCVQYVEKSELRIGVKVSLGGHQHLLTLLNILMTSTPPTVVVVNLSKMSALSV
ncbi:hypothetical protein Vadar_024782 [Vaccinium darrowii]|uniref:Uncharacterized protein n=1 Tax=Vaccinium darrowii TaxID=229202 RepID=A0ACB7YYB2_9ERIC|nr:hypothetical protein Vadar_024782 [Vaccinium darrowii]